MELVWNDLGFVLVLLFLGELFGSLFSLELLLCVLLCDCFLGKSNNEAEKSRVRRGSLKLKVVRLVVGEFGEGPELADVLERLSKQDLVRFLQGFLGHDREELLEILRCLARGFFLGELLFRVMEVGSLVRLGPGGFSGGPD